MVRAPLSRGCDSAADRAPSLAVKHKDQIDDLSMWKQTPDHFFYKDFFDPYIKREFAIVPVTSLRNRQCSLVIKVCKLHR